MLLYAPHCNIVMQYWYFDWQFAWSKLEVQRAFYSLQSRSLRFVQFGQVAGRIVVSCKDLLENVPGVITVYDTGRSCGQSSGVQPSSLDVVSP